MLLILLSTADDSCVTSEQSRRAHVGRFPLVNTARGGEGMAVTLAGISLLTLELVCYDAPSPSLPAFALACFVDFLPLSHFGLLVSYLSVFSQPAGVQCINPRMPADCVLCLFLMGVLHDVHEVFGYVWCRGQGDVAVPFRGERAREVQGQEQDCHVP